MSIYEHPTKKGATVTKKRRKSSSTPPQQSQEIDYQELKNQRLANSLTSLVTGIVGSDGTNQISQVDTLFKNSRWYLLSNMRQIVSELYIEHGIVQTLIDQPVQDAFRTGFDIICDELSPDEMADLEAYVDETNVMQVIEQAGKWQRLYGGSGVLIITAQDAKRQLAELAKGSPLMFRAVDMWELYHTNVNQTSTDYSFALEDPKLEFNYYGQQVHKSRVLTLKGKEAPSYIRPRLRGWGMSELERLVRSINSYLKNQGMIFELLDEAKIDIFKIMDFNASLMTENGTQLITDRVQEANKLKNYLSAITMDTNDEYIQKQMNFSGLGDMLQQIRQGIAADLKMPMTKLFGLSAAGFNSGEDDIENYNSMIEGEVRSKIKYVIIDALKLCCQHLFGYTPEGLTIEWGALRILSSEQEEKVKNDKLNRTLSAYSAGLISPKEAKQAINQANLLPIEIQDSDETFDNPTGDFKVEDEEAE